MYGQQYKPSSGKVDTIDYKHQSPSPVMYGSSTKSSAKQKATTDYDGSTSYQDCPKMTRMYGQRHTESPPITDYDHRKLNDPSVSSIYKQNYKRVSSFDVEDSCNAKKPRVGLADYQNSPLKEKRADYQNFNDHRQYQTRFHDNYSSDKLSDQPIHSGFQKSKAELASPHQSYSTASKFDDSYAKDKSYYDSEYSEGKITSYDYYHSTVDPSLSRFSNLSPDNLFGSPKGETDIKSSYQTYPGNVSSLTSNNRYSKDASFDDTVYSLREEETELLSSDQSYHRTQDSLSKYSDEKFSDEPLYSGLNKAKAQLSPSPHHYSEADFSVSKFGSSYSQDTCKLFDKPVSSKSRGDENLHMSPQGSYRSDSSTADYSYSYSKDKFPYTPKNTISQKEETDSTRRQSNSYRRPGLLMSEMNDRSDKGKFPGKQVISGSRNNETSTQQSYLGTHSTHTKFDSYSDDKISTYNNQRSLYRQTIDYVLDDNIIDERKHENYDDTLSRGFSSPKQRFQENYDEKDRTKSFVEFEDVHYTQSSHRRNMSIPYAETYERERISGDQLNEAKAGDTNRLGITESQNQSFKSDYQSGIAQTSVPDVDHRMEDSFNIQGLLEGTALERAQVNLDLLQKAKVAVDQLIGQVVHSTGDKVDGNTHPGQQIDSNVSRYQKNEREDLQNLKTNSDINQEGSQKSAISVALQILAKSGLVSKGEPQKHTSGTKVSSDTQGQSQTAGSFSKISSLSRNVTSNPFGSCSNNKESGTSIFGPPKPPGKKGTSILNLSEPIAATVQSQEDRNEGKSIFGSSKQNIATLQTTDRPNAGKSIFDLSKQNDATFQSGDNPKLKITFKTYQDQESNIFGMSKQNVGPLQSKNNVDIQGMSTPNQNFGKNMSGRPEQNVAWSQEERNPNSSQMRKYSLTDTFDHTSGKQFSQTESQAIRQAIQASNSDDMDIDEESYSARIECNLPVYPLSENYESQQMGQLPNYPPTHMLSDRFEGSMQPYTPSKPKIGGRLNKSLNEVRENEEYASKATLSSTQDKIRRFGLFLQSMEATQNAFQTMNIALIRSGLDLKIEYLTEKLTDGDNGIVTGWLCLDGVFIFRSFGRILSSLMNLVYEKSLEILKTKNIHEILSRKDIDVAALKRDFHRDKRSEDSLKPISTCTKMAASETSVKASSSGNMGPSFVNYNRKCQVNVSDAQYHKLVYKAKRHPINKAKHPTISMLFKMIESAGCGQTASYEKYHLWQEKNPQLFYRSIFLLNNIPIGFGENTFHHDAQRQCIKKVLETLKLPFQKMKKGVTVPDNSKCIEVPQDEGGKLSLNGKLEKLVNFAKYTTFSNKNLILNIDKLLKAFSLRVSVLFKKENVANRIYSTCEFYLEELFIASGQGEDKTMSQRAAYKNAWLKFGISNVFQLMNQRKLQDEDVHNPENEYLHRKRRKDPEALTMDQFSQPKTELSFLVSKARDLLKGRESKKEDLHNSENLQIKRPQDPVALTSNSYSHPETEEKPLILFEFTKWSKDRKSFAFFIIKHSALLSGKSINWTAEKNQQCDKTGDENRFTSSVTIDEEVMGSGNGKNKEQAKDVASWDALLKLYPLKSAIEIIVDTEADERNWITWGSITKKDGQTEKGGSLSTNTSPDKNHVQACFNLIDDIAKEPSLKQLIFAPDFPAMDKSKIINYVKKIEALALETRFVKGSSYIVIYWKTLPAVSILNMLRGARNDKHVRYRIIPKSEIPESTKKVNDIKKDLTSKNISSDSSKLASGSKKGCQTSSKSDSLPKDNDSVGQILTASSKKSGSSMQECNPGRVELDSALKDLQSSVSDSNTRSTTNRESLPLKSASHARENIFERFAHDPNISGSSAHDPNISGSSAHDPNTFGSSAHDPKISGSSSKLKSERSDTKTGDGQSSGFTSGTKDSHSSQSNLSKSETYTGTRNNENVDCNTKCIDLTSPRSDSKTRDGHSSRYRSRSRDRHSPRSRLSSRDRHSPRYRSRSRDRHSPRYRSRSRDRHSSRYRSRSRNRHSPRYRSRSRDRHSTRYRSRSRSRDRHSPRYRSGSRDRYSTRSNPRVRDRHSSKSNAYNRTKDSNSYRSRSGTRTRNNDPVKVNLKEQGGETDEVVVLEKPEPKEVEVIVLSDSDIEGSVSAGDEELECSDVDSSDFNFLVVDDVDNVDDLEGDDGTDVNIEEGKISPF